MLQPTRVSILAAALAVNSIGCGNSRNAELAAMVRIVGPGDKCFIELEGGGSSQPMPCARIVAYLRQSDPRVAGSRIGVASTDEVSLRAVDSVVADLTRAGFQVGPVMRVGFISEPGGIR